MSLFENVQAMCALKRITIADLERGSGLKESTVTKWKTTSPSYDKVVSVADFFGITIDELLGRSAPSLSTADRQILELFHQLNEEGQGAAIAMLQGLSHQPAYIKSDRTEELGA